MPDRHFTDPRLVAVYDAVDGERVDLDPYVAMVEEFGARRVLDIGSGTGVFATRLAARGIDVVGVDPAPASVAYARARPGGDRVRWIEGDATALPQFTVDMVTMTGNVAQAIVDDEAWRTTLRRCWLALHDDGRLVFETRDPDARGWEDWTPEATRRTVHVDGIGEVTSWTELTSVELPLVSFRGTWRFADGTELTSDSTLCFRDYDEVVAELQDASFVVEEVRDAPDRPGLELVIVARPEREGDFDYDW
ncbi:class I SAM-dependent methyltransferase [Pseudonocardia sp. CA-107938]|uniref:class I SAM-dependent methyltransferase n=1 Tax=Pseudonocardia sp. CA-107938 TaxID=3240021 RepID=UPI003D93E969